MANLNLIAKRKRELCGNSIEVNNFNPELAVLMKLTLAGKPVTKENMLITKMESMLDTVPENIRPFCEAVCDLYKQSKDENKLIL